MSFFFIGIDLDKFSITITCSPMDPLQWMGAVRMRPESCCSCFCIICTYFSPDSDKMTFSLEKAILWINDLYFSKKPQFKVINLNDGFFFFFFFTNMQLFASQDLSNWYTGVTCILLWRFYQHFESILVALIHPLVSKWCNATFLMKKNSSTSCMVRREVNFHFWANYSFKK